MAASEWPGTVWLREHWAELVASTNFEWVAASGAELVAHDPDLDVVMRAVIARGMQRAVVYTFVDAPEIEP